MYVAVGRSQNGKETEDRYECSRKATVRGVLLKTNALW